MNLEAPTSSFHHRVQDAFQNPGRLEAIRQAAARFYEHRDAVLGALQDADALRDLARLIRAHTIANLDTYLVQFEVSVQQAGGQVHWARDAAEARSIVLDIACQADAKRIAKSKSMVTEEIRLNKALMDAGLEVIETDLGEFIAQLGGDHPSHIIAPVLHLTRQEIGAIFQEKLGVDYTDDPLALNQIAREKLREVYLSSDIGITGCNFAVAESGTICLATNEGNGRMVTTLPRVHIAIMGMERIVPTLDDLAVMLQLLGRSATGQKMTVYTSLINGPRRQGDPHGPDAVHVIILDNGRTKALAGDLAEILYCIRCGACLNVCPVYKTIGGHAYGSVYPGPVGAIISPILGGIPAFADLPHASTLCGACQEVCPVRIDLPALLLRLRRDTVVEGQSPSWLRRGMQIYAKTASKPSRFSLATGVAALGTRLLGRDWIRLPFPGPLAAWTRFRHFPVFARRIFQHQLKDDQHE
nr:iron-sulfur cluster-binding protein [Anaerolineae bacterium]